jgi:hypothetical protein
MAFRKQFLKQQAEVRGGDPFVIPSLPSSSPPFEATTSLMLSSEAMTIGGGGEEEELDLDLKNVLIDTPSSTLDFFEPVSWSSYFDSQDFVTLPNSNV